MLAVAGVGASLSDPGRAQPAPSAIEIVSTLAADAGPVAPDSLAPKVSDDGNIVVFDSTTPTADPAAPTSTVTVRDRVAGTTTSVPDTPSLHPGISADGCVVAYSVPVAASDEVQLTALDRCAATGGAMVGSAVAVDTVRAPEALPAPAVSADGSVIVWSTGRTISRYVQSGTGWEVTPITVPPETFGSSSVVTGRSVDTSADGNVVTFVAGPGTADFEPAPANVFVWSDADGAGSATATVELASISRSGGPSTGDSTAPSVSGDGRLVVFESASTDLFASDSTGAVAPFVVLLDRLGSARVLAAGAGRPSISTDGKVLVYDTSTDVHQQRWVGGANAFEAVSERSLSIGRDNLTPAGPSVSGPVVSGDGSVAVFDSTNGAALSTDARFATGQQVWARSTLDDPATSTTTTTVPASTTTTAPRPANPTYQTPRSTVPPSRSSSGSSGSRRPVGSGSSSTNSSVGPVEQVTFEPVSVQFSPTIVSAGRQSSVVTLSNPTARPVTVTELSIRENPDGAFTIPDGACVGTPVLPDGVCEVVVTFAPTTVGPATAQIVAVLSDGTEAYGDLAGTGAAPPVVAVVPGVASSGQVVAIQGSGFPAGAQVALSWLDGDPVTIGVDETGSFVETLIVLPHTSRGPAAAVVAGQADLFATVVGKVLITETSDRSSSVLTQSAGSPFAS